MITQSSFVIKKQSMLTLKTLREDPELVIRKLAKKHFDAREIVMDVIAMDDRRKPSSRNPTPSLASRKRPPLKSAPS